MFRKTWDIRTSVIDSFATFFLLSYVKLLSISADLLIPTTIYKLGSNEVQFGLYYSPSVRYFDDEHLPYAITATVILTLFVCIPTLILIIYPSHFFQKFLSLFPFNWHYLHAFVDSFQGYYKDGTEPGTFDSRWFSTNILLTRLLCFIIFGTTLTMMYFVYSLIAFLILLVAVVNIQPFKKVDSHYPSTDTVFYILLCLFLYCMYYKRYGNKGKLFTVDLNLKFCDFNSLCSFSVYSIINQFLADLKNEMIMLIFTL